MTPVIVGCVVGVVWPAGIVTLKGDMVRVLVSVLDNATVTAAAAACGSVTAKVAVFPRPTVGLVGRPIVPAVTTVTATVVLGRFGASVLAVMVAEPKVTAVTSTFTLVAPGAKFTLVGTVATLGALEFKLIVKPAAGAAPDRFNATVCVAIPVMVTVGGAKLMVAFTCTVTLAEVTPVPVAVMFAEPRLTPVIVGWVPGVDWPARIVILAGVMVSFVISLLARAIVRFTGAGLARLTANGTDAPSPTVGLAGRITVAGAATVTLAVASAMFGRLAA